MTDEERKKAIDILERKHSCMNTNCLSVKQLCSECPRGTTNDEVDSAIITALEALKQQPKFIAHSDGTIEQITTREHGEWLEVWESRQDINGEYDEWEEYKCSKCGFQDVNIDSYDVERYKFCPNCGAEMEGPR